MGEILTVETTGISDADGLDNATFTYQWVADDTDISGAAASSYTLVDSDAGKAIKVTVSFTDDAGNQESLTSAATGLVAGAGPAVPPAKPGSLTASEISHDSVTLTWDDPQDDTINGYIILRRDKDIHEEGTFEAVEANTGTAETTYTDTSVQPERRYVYRIKAINAYGESEISSWVRAYTPADPSAEPPARPGALTASEISHDSVTLTWDDPQDDTITGYIILRRDKDIHEEGTFETVEANTATAETTYTDTSVQPERRYVYRIKAINAHGESEISSWVRAYTPAAPSAEQNSPAMGGPAIGGTAQVDEVLTVSTSGIADADGVTNATFSYQWLADDSEITGAISSTYILTDSDEGKAIKVRVSFTDDEGNDESLTSAPTATVAAAPTPLTASIHDAPESHDGQNAFTFELRFSEEFELSYVTLRDHAFTVTGGSVTKVRRLQRDSDEPNRRWEITIEPESNASLTIVLPVPADCDDQGAVCTGDGRKLSNRLEFTVSGTSG